MLLGFVREVCRIVPPVRSNVRTFSGGSVSVQSSSVAGLSGIDLQEAQPAAPKAEHLHVVVLRADRDGLDRHVEAGHVAAAGEDADASSRHGVLPSERWT